MNIGGLTYSLLILLLFLDCIIIGLVFVPLGLLLIDFLIDNIKSRKENGPSKLCFLCKRKVVDDDSEM